MYSFLSAHPLISLFQCYLAIAKGALNDDHVLICPVSHHNSTVVLPDVRDTRKCYFFLLFLYYYVVRIILQAYLTCIFCWCLPPGQRNLKSTFAQIIFDLLILVCQSYEMFMENYLYIRILFFFEWKRTQNKYTRTPLLVLFSALLRHDFSFTQDKRTFEWLLQLDHEAFFDSE